MKKNKECVQQNKKQYTFNVTKAKTRILTFYKYRYEIDDCDLFAVYVLDKKILFFISAEQVLNHKNGIKIRLTPSKNGQIKNITTLESLKTFEEIIDEMKNKKNKR